MERNKVSMLSWVPGDRVQEINVEIENNQADLVVRALVRQSVWKLGFHLSRDMREKQQAKGNNKQ